MKVCKEVKEALKRMSNGKAVGPDKKKIKEEIVGGGTERCFCYGG